MYSHLRDSTRLRRSRRDPGPPNPRSHGQRRARIDPVARNLAFLASDLAIWNLGSTLFTWTAEPTWHWLDVTFSPLTPPLVLNLVLAYVGLTRHARSALLTAYAAYAALTLASATAWFSAWGREFIASPRGLSSISRAGSPIFIACLALLIREARRHRDLPVVAMRARLLVAALVLAGLLGSTEFWNDLFEVPALGTIGVFLATIIMAAVVFRFGLFATRERLALTLYLGLFVLVLGVLLPPGTSFLQRGLGFSPHATAQIFLRTPADPPEQAPVAIELDTDWAGNFTRVFDSAEAPLGDYLFWAIDAATGAVAETATFTMVAH